MKIQTVLGPLSPDKLGVTYPYIHIYIKEETEPGNILPDIDKNVEELVDFKKAGGNSVVDGGFWPPRAKELAEIFKRSKVNIIATSGLRGHKLLKKRRVSMKKPILPKH